MERLHDHSGQVNDVHAILVSAGFQIRGKRATCPYCDGHRRLTVAITDDGLWYCHRCHRKGSAHSLAHEQGISLPPRPVRRANTPKLAFRAWLSSKMGEMAHAERELTCQWRRAIAALDLDPENESAWQALADFYNKQRYCETFWESASDNIGRYWLFRAWRRHYAP